MMAEQFCCPDNLNKFFCDILVNNDNIIKCFKSSDYFITWHVCLDVLYRLQIKLYSGKICINGDLETLYETRNY